MTVKRITIPEIEYVAYALARQFMEWNEPIPEFGTRFPNILESCVAVPFQTFNKKQLYGGLIKKAAILFYLMIKNHPFQNGNKRIAMTAMFYFFYKNRRWLRVDNQELYNFAKWVAESNPKLKDETLLAVNKFFSSNMVLLDKD
jgi:death-on-curing family protein